MMLNSRWNFQAETVSLKTYLQVCCMLCILTVLVYGNILTSEFISYDDPLYLLDRSQVWGGLTFESVRWALTSTIDANWIPLTWLSYLLDVSLFGVNAHAHHAVNLLFHLTNSLLLLTAIWRMTGYFWRSTVVAALFALHPMHVESVAWIAERKDVLSGFFFMLCVFAYYSYSIRPSISRYFLVIILYAMGLCSKSMLVTMPFLLLLLDYWPLHRTFLLPRNTCLSTSLSGIPQGRSLCWLFAEKIPLLCLAVISGVITYNVQKQAGAVVEYSDSTLVENIANAAISYVTYIYKLVVPLNLAVLYPFDFEISPWQPILAVLFLVIVSFLVVRCGREYPYLPIGWFWFAGTLVPVIGIIAVGSHSMADRYTYLPFIGLFLMIVWGGADIAAIKKTKIQIRIGLVIATAALMSALTWVQVGYWHDSITLFKHAIRVTENNWVAYEQLGAVFQVRGDLNQAEIYINESIRIKPRNAGAYTTLGIIFQNRRENDRAVNCFKIALEIDPNYGSAHYELGKNLLFNGDMNGARNELGILQNIDPERAANLMKVISQVGTMMQLNEK